MGCATAKAAAEGGCRVLLLERDKIGSLQGSSHGQSRIMRLSYGHSHYIPLCRKVYPLWHELEHASGRTLFEQTGVVDIAMRPVESWSSTERAMRETGVAFERLDKAAMQERFPQFAIAQDAAALYQADAGVLHADLCLQVIASEARRLGAILKEGETALSLKPEGSAVEVVTDKNTYRASRLVLAAGTEMGLLLDRLGLPLPLKVSKEQVAFFVPRDRERFAAGRLPLFILHFGNGILGSGFPMLRETGMKLMIENKRPVADGDFSVDRPLLETLVTITRQLLPDLNDEPIRVETCRYTNSPDEDFIIGRHPRFRQIVLISACSGHGFKFAPLFGKVLARLCMDKDPGIDLSLFDPERFQTAGYSASSSSLLS